jgi:TolA-binding protein
MSRSLSLIGSISLVALLVTLTTAQDTKAPAKPKGRLPAYYGDVVSEKQRSEIYSIQSKYADQIKKLQDEIKALSDKRDTEIEGVLTAEQKAKVATLKAEAAKKKTDKAAADDAKPGEPAKEAPKSATTTPAKTTSK